MFDRIADEVNCDKVIVDDYESAINAMEHLIKTGCKKIALFSAIDNLSVGKLRAKGFFKSLEDKGFEIDKNLVVLTDNPDDFDNQMPDFFKNNKVDGIFAVDEHASVMAMKYGIKNGYKIPENLL